MTTKIKDLPINERPCERLIEEGAHNLNNEELLAIMIKTGTKEMSAKELASLILSEIKDIKNIKDINYETLSKIKGIGMAKSCVILASIELGKRINREIDTLSKVKLNGSKLVYDYYRQRIGDKRQEYFYCVYLDNAKNIIKDKLLFIGTINYSVVHPREVFKEAYLLSASGIICVHNHPSNNILPSREDLAITNTLIEAGNLLGIKVVDHIIIGENNYYSFLENGDI